MLVVIGEQPAVLSMVKSASGRFMTVIGIGPKLLSQPNVVKDDMRVTLYILGFGVTFT